MTTPKSDLLEQYAQAIEPLLPLAQRAYGSRDTVSPQHAASREMTRLLKEFYNANGSLLDMAARLGVNYAGLRRRVTTADTKPSSHRARKKFPQEVYDTALQEIRDAKAADKDTYHRCLYKHWAAGLSMSKIAKELKLSSANPLYYGINRIKALEDKVN